MRLAQILFAISLMVEECDILYYTCATISAIFFLSSIIMYITIFKEDRWRILSLISGSKAINLLDCFIGIIGIIVCLRCGYTSLSYYWWTYCIIAIIAVISPMKTKI